MKEDKMENLFRNLTARKISLLSRLADLSEEEIKIIRLRWLDGKSDIQVCDILGMSLSTLYRKRQAAKQRVADALDLYGLSDLDSLPAEDLLDYNGLFYKAQDELVRFFMRHRDKEEQEMVHRILKFLAEN